MTSIDTKTCKGNDTVEYPDGTILASVPYHIDGVPKDHRCHDCNVELGGFHHPGCDMERCPKCGGQLISCGCLDEEDDRPTRYRIVIEVESEELTKRELELHLDYCVNRGYLFGDAEVDQWSGKVIEVMEETDYEDPEGEG